TLTIPINYLFNCSRHLLNLHSFPTRRSSDLNLDSLGRQLHDASNSVENLAELVTGSTEEARQFTASCQHDPREACSEYSLLPLRSEEHTSELQSPYDLVCRLLLEKKKTTRHK